MFKRDVKKYSSFSEVVSSLELLAKVDESLNLITDKSELQVLQHEKVIVISSEENAQIIKDWLNAPESSEKGLKLEESREEVEIVEEYIEEADDDHCREEIEPTAELSKEEDGSEAEQFEMSFVSEDTELIEDSEQKPKRRRSRKYKYPSNTNEKLTEDQKTWINRQVRDCQMTRDGKRVYKCPLCETYLQVSGSLKKHIRDTHLLKTVKQQETCNSRRAFKTEILDSKMILMTADGPETIWRCQRCQRCDNNRIFRSEAGLKVHIRYNHIRNKIIDANFVAQCKIVESDNRDAWKCPQCAKILRSRDGLRNHIKLEHPDFIRDTPSMEQSNSRQLLNDDIDDTAKNDALVNLLKRKQRTLKDNPSATSCGDCGIQFVNGTRKQEKSCQIHQQCHTILGTIAQYYQLPKCDDARVMFSNDDDLNRYLSTDLPYFEPLPCDGMVAKVSQKLTSAVGNAIDEDSWTCGHCGAKYQTEVDCNAHQLILHSKKLICPVDHMEFEGNRGMSQFNIHMRNKHANLFPELTISCTYCHEEFASNFEKLAHMKTCSEKKFECDHCGRKYFTKTELIRHLKIISGEIAYVCDLCSKACASTMDLKLHRTSHTNQKSYACSYPDCNKAFKTPAARSSHMETHSNVSYACSFCSASFRQRALLQRHVRKGCCKGRKEPSTKVMLEEMFTEGQMYEVAEISN